MKFKILPSILLLFASWFFLTNSMRDPNNPPTGKTGAPGENTCSTQSGCHNGGTYVGTVTISGVPDTVVANQTYTITLTNTSNAVRAGFQLTSWDGANAMSGTLTAGTGVSVGSGAAGKKYARQSSPKTLSGGATSWSFTWKAPATASGNIITFYYVSLCANGNGQKTGDIAIQGNKIVTLQSTSAVSNASADNLVKFYPTLVQSNRLHIEVLESGNSEVLIFDMNGKLVLQQALSTTNDLNVNQLERGIYTAQIRVNEKSTTKKFVVE